MPAPGRKGAHLLGHAGPQYLEVGVQQNNQDMLFWAAELTDLMRCRYERVSTVQRTGFVNQDLLDHLDLDLARARPQDMRVTWGKWMWSHLPEKYAADHFHEALAALKSGSRFVNTNLPEGHVFREWTMEEELERQEKGIRSDFKKNGDWRTQ